MFSSCCTNYSTMFSNGGFAPSAMSSCADFHIVSIAGTALVAVLVLIIGIILDLRIACISIGIITLLVLITKNKKQFNNAKRFANLCK